MMAVGVEVGESGDCAVVGTAARVIDDAVEIPVGVPVGVVGAAVGVVVGGTVGAIDVVRGEHHIPIVSQTHTALVVHVVWSEMA
jgi:hypothetical protein